MTSLSDTNTSARRNALRRSVCGIEELSRFESESITHVLSLVDPDLDDLVAFSRYSHHHRTILRFHDILDPRPGWIMPEPQHIEEILRFGERSGLVHASGVEMRHLLVHCHMGVSRSTAAMITLMAQAHPEARETELFAELRETRPQAWPNSRMIAFADEALARGGRLVAALREHYSHQLEIKPEFREWMTGLGRQIELEMAASAA